MSSRVFKKRYGRNELEDLEQKIAFSSAAKSLSSNLNLSGDEIESEDEHIPSQVCKKQNLFALALETEEASAEEANIEEEVDIQPEQIVSSNSSKPSRKKKNKKKKSKQKEVEENIDELLSATSQLKPVNNEPSVSLNGFNPLGIQLKSLNPEYEMKKKFGQKVVSSNETSRRRPHQTHRRTTHMVTPAQGWHPVTKSGLAMTLVGQDGDSQVFQIEHNSEYQRVQQTFWDAVDSMAPENLTAVLRLHPYHIDTLLQLSEVCRMSEDPQMAAELIERTLYAYETTFHPLFNLSTGKCRLKYTNWENRGIFLALFRHIMNVGNRGCYRTSLEYCKLLLGLDPDVDPLCVLLMIDFYALRSEEFSYLLQLYQLWNPARNLRILPNFAFSVPLAMFHTSQPDTAERNAANSMLQESLMMFPGILQPLLDACAVDTQEDKVINKHFGASLQYRQPASLKQLVHLYVGRASSCWKAPECIAWLEENVSTCCNIGDSEPKRFEELTNRGHGLFKGLAPQNVCRHLILTDIKEAVADLPAEVTSTAVLSYDPLPPFDTIRSYERQQRRQRQISNQGFLSAFLNSLMPNFDVNAMAEDRPDGAGGGANLIDAVRDMLRNIELAPPERDDGEDEAPPPQDWD
ncbi:ribosome quality control complex subunit TCF25-like [Watersipora subatra]|uniref:ribosome quality control complex subunit TCF25-like n=1 Tax=Watersipora subatra TaxID=2589382 RepID=UPI00355B086E